MKGQASLEFMAGLIFMILIFLSLLFTLNTFIDENRTTVDSLTYFIENFNQKVNLIAQSKNDVMMRFEFPETINGFNYTFNILNDTHTTSVFIINISGTVYTRSIPLIINKTPLGEKGFYTLEKNNTKIYISR